MIEKKCVFCGKIFREYPCNAEKRKFCSIKCYYKHPKSVDTIKKLKEKNAGKNIGRKRPDLSLRNKLFKSIENKGNQNSYKFGTGVYGKRAFKLFGKKCCRCGKDSGRIEVHHKNRNRLDNPTDGSNWEVLCRSCHAIEHNCGYTLKHEAERWHSKLIPGMFGLEFDEELKEKVRNRDNYTCQICNKSQEDNKVKLAVHHVDYNKNNNSESNLISICTCCHAITNFNREKWFNYFKGSRIQRLQRKYGTICVHIATRERPVELCVLLASLRNQSYNNFALMIFDDASSQPLQNNFVFSGIIDRLKHDGHVVLVYRNSLSTGVCNARNKLIEESEKMCNDFKYVLRLDDDLLLEPDYIEKLLDVLEAGFTMATGIVPAMQFPLMQRENRFVKPFINDIELNPDGSIKRFGDDCGWGYMDEEIIPAVHFRTNLLYPRELHVKGLRYPKNLSLVGFREETFFSLRAILLGQSLGCHTGAISWHSRTPVGGCRFPNYQEHVRDDLEVFNEWLKDKVMENGDFLVQYKDKVMRNDNK